jgi:hypothetical protein
MKKKVMGRKLGPFSKINNIFIVMESVISTIYLKFFIQRKNNLDCIYAKMSNLNSKSMG